MNTRLYLERIGYFGPLDPSLEVLTNLQQNHLLRVPFENLDIHNKTRIDLANTYAKVVTGNRGGFCYELNNLFFELLKELGFHVKRISARVFDKDKGFGPEFDHMAILANIDAEKYLVDVGFGEFAFHPLKIELNLDQRDPRGIFRIQKYDEEYFMAMKKNPERTFLPEYIFSEKERRLDEFNEMCLYHQTSPQSHFTQKRMCSLPTINGRITLTGNTLKITANGEVTETLLGDEMEVQKILSDYFKISNYNL